MSGSPVRDALQVGSSVPGRGLQANLALKISDAPTPPASAVGGRARARPDHRRRGDGMADGMGGGMAIWFEVARRGFRRHATYRAATAAGVFTNTVFGFIQAFVLLGVFRTGDVVSDLYRPLDLQAYWFAQDVGRALFHALFRGIPPFLLGGLVFALRLSPNPVHWLVFVVSVVLAATVSFGIRFLVNLTAFWFLDIRGANQIVTVVWGFLSGILLPITFFPPGLEAVARVSPFAAVVQSPLELLFGKHHGAGLLRVLATQLAWAVVLFGAGRMVLAAAVRKVVVQGG